MKSKNLVHAALFLKESGVEVNSTNMQNILRSFGIDFQEQLINLFVDSFNSQIGNIDLGNISFNQSSVQNQSEGPSPGETPSEIPEESPPVEEDEGEFFGGLFD